MVDNYVVLEFETQPLTKRNHPKLFIATICKNKTTKNTNRRKKKKIKYFDTSVSIIRLS